MNEAQIQLERNKLPLYQDEKKRVAMLERHYSKLVKDTIAKIKVMEKVMEAEAKASEG